MSKPELDMRYYKGEIDDNLPYTGVINVDPETGLFYDENGNKIEITGEVSDILEIKGNI